NASLPIEGSTASISLAKQRTCIVDLLASGGITLMLKGSGKRRTGLVSADTPKRPSSMPPHEWLCIPQRTNQRWPCHRITGVAERYTDVAQQTTPLCSLYRTVAEALAEAVLV